MLSPDSFICICKWSYIANSREEQAANSASLLRVLRSDDIQLLVFRQSTNQSTSEAVKLENLPRLRQSVRRDNSSVYEHPTPTYNTQVQWQRFTSAAATQTVPSKKKLWSRSQNNSIEYSSFLKRERERNGQVAKLTAILNKKHQKMMILGHCYSHILTTYRHPCDEILAHKKN